MNEIAQSTLEQARLHFENAREESARPEEDVVPYSVCSHAYKAVQHYLTGFLQQHGAQVHTTNPLDALLIECRKVDVRFNELDLTAMMHAEDPEDVWMNIDVMRDYLYLADKTRNMVTRTPVN